MEFFGRVNLNFDDNIFINADLNYEGSSKFGTNNKWGFFYGVGAGASLDDLFDIEGFDNLKLRVSLGQTGNEPLGSYLSLQRFGPAGSFYYDGAYVSSYAPQSNANPNLAWEKTQHINVGIDFATQNSKLFGAVEWFSRTTKDQLLQVTVPVPPNLVSTTLLNIGETNNSGVEVSANYQVVDNSSLIAHVPNATISEVEILSPVQGLQSESHKIVAINNSNGIGIHSMWTTQASGIVTCILDTPILGFSSAPFKVGDTMPLVITPTWPLSM